MSSDKKQLDGKRGEDIAAKHMRMHGYHIICRRYRCRAGEIDIIAMDGDTLVFCEVKARNGIGFGTPAEAVTALKQQNIIKTAEYYLIENPHDCPMRFDVIEVMLENSKVNLIKGAFTF